jgi:hypothetical protein
MNIHHVIITAPKGFLFLSKKEPVENKNIIRILNNNELPELRNRPDTKNQNGLVENSLQMPILPI